MFGFKRKEFRLKTDEELIGLFKSDRSELCVTILYERYAHLVLGTAMKYLKNSQDAEDLAMNLFEKLPLKLLEHDIAYFKGWLYRVVKNDCFMLLRKKNRITSELTESMEMTNEEIPTSPIEEQLQVLEDILPSLKEDQRICVELFYLKDMSYQQISEHLNISILAVKSAIQNGKRNLKIRLETHSAFTNENE
jgi:RNA polymerase sigma factor (sigma-70 family)